MSASSPVFLLATVQTTVFCFKGCTCWMSVECFVPWQCCCTRNVCKPFLFPFCTSEVLSCLNEFIGSSKYFISKDTDLMHQGSLNFVLKVYEAAFDVCVVECVRSGSCSDNISPSGSWVAMWLCFLSPAIPDDGIAQDSDDEEKENPDKRISSEYFPHSLGWPGWVKLIPLHDRCTSHVLFFTLFWLLLEGLFQNMLLFMEYEESRCRVNGNFRAGKFCCAHDLQPPVRLYFQVLSHFMNKSRSPVHNEFPCLNLSFFSYLSQCSACQWQESRPW